MPSRPLLTDGQPDFPSVLERAGVTADQRLRVQKAQDLLKLLPAGTSPALKRKIVEATFSAFDIPMQDIIGAASAHLEALDAYVAATQHTKQQTLDEGDARVRELQRQIAEVRAQTDWAVAAEEAREVATRVEIARIEPVLAFFLHSQLDEDPTAVEEAPPVQAEPTGEEPMLVDYVEIEVEVEVEAEVEGELDPEAPAPEAEAEGEDVELELDLDEDPDTSAEVDVVLPADAPDVVVVTEIAAVPFAPEPDREPGGGRLEG